MGPKISRTKSSELSSSLNIEKSNSKHSIAMPLLVKLLCKWICCYDVKLISSNGNAIFSHKTGCETDDKTAQVLVGYIEKCSVPTLFKNKHCDAAILDKSNWILSRRQAIVVALFDLKIP